MQNFAISLGHILVYDHFDYNYKRRKLDFNQLTNKKSVHQPPLLPVFLFDIT